MDTLLPADLHNHREWVRLRPGRQLQKQRKQYAGLQLKRELLDFACFDQCYLHRADFTKASLRDACFVGCYFSSCIWQEASLARADFTCSRGAGKSVFSRADAQAALFGRAKLPNTLFYAADLSAASFRNASLRGSVFASATLCQADFTGADLRQADFTAADTKQAKGLVPRDTALTSQVATAILDHDSAECPSVVDIVKDLRDLSAYPAWGDFTLTTLLLDAPACVYSWDAAQRRAWAMGVQTTGDVLVSVPASLSGDGVVP